jgi:nucleotide-binding universal stress UspA family protein
VARLLVVAHQTADSPELAAALQQAIGRDSTSTFVLLVPATPIQHVRGWTEGEAKAVANEAGERARKYLERHGVKLESIRVGDPDPVEAAADEWNDHPDYDQVILSTFAKETSRWLKGNAVERLKKRLPIPVTHVASAHR